MSRIKGIKNRPKYLKTTHHCPECGIGLLQLRIYPSIPDIREECGKILITHSYEMLCDNENCKFDHVGWTTKEWD